MAETKDIQGVANKKIEYTYTTGDRVILSIGTATLSFEWLGGHLDGTKIEGLSYICNETREGQFLINWHNKNAHAFVTLLIDLEKSKVYGSAIVEYLGDEPFEIFDEAAITQVSKLN